MRPTQSAHRRRACSARRAQALGGPEALGIDAWARRLFAATGDERAVVSDPHARYFGTELKGGELTPGDGARVGATDFDTWFVTQQQGAGR